MNEALAKPSSSMVEAFRLLCCVVGFCGYFGFACLDFGRLTGLQVVWLVCGQPLLLTLGVGAYVQMVIHVLLLQAGSQLFLLCVAFVACFWQVLFGGVSDSLVAPFL